MGSDGESMELSGIPDMRDLFPPWHDEAACRDLGDVADKLYFQEIARMKELTQGLASPATLAAVLICETCPVRRPCLRAALDPPVFETRLDEHKRMTTHTIPPRTFGVWAGSVESERWALRDHPVDEAIDLLEATFQRRLEIRLAAYREARNALRSRPLHGDELRPRHVTKMDRLVDELLAKRQVKTSRVGAGRPGPGRGRKGPIARYAEEHGVSRSTAWRRLRAA